MNEDEIDRPEEFKHRIPSAPIRERYQGCPSRCRCYALGAPVEFLSRAKSSMHRLAF